MADIRFLTQPDSTTLYEVINEILNSKEFHEFNFAVAFAKESGIKYIENSLYNFENNGGKSKAFIGIDMFGTSYEALKKLYDIIDELYVVHIINSRNSFHPKIYNFKNDDTSILIIGSHNMTGGGLASNIESSIILTLSYCNANDRYTQIQVDQYFDWLKNYAPDDINISLHIESNDDISYLMNDCGLIKSEALIQVDNNKRLKGINKEHTNTKFPTTIGIKDKKQQRKKSNSQKDSDDNENKYSELGKYFNVLWVESNITGGSANQLNLSKNGPIIEGNPSGTGYEDQRKGYMQGTLLFFGIDENHVDQDTFITIEYNGINFSKNKIHYYHSGKGKNPNESWRLQLQGTSEDGNKMTAAYQEQSLLHKIITFTRLDDESYKMDIYPEEQLKEFESKSELIGRNHSKNGKLFGLYNEY